MGRFLDAIMRAQVGSSQGTIQRFPRVGCCLRGWSQLAPPFAFLRSSHHKALGNTCIGHSHATIAACLSPFGDAYVVELAIVMSTVSCYIGLSTAQIAGLVCLRGCRCLTLRCAKSVHMPGTIESDNSERAVPIPK